MPAPQSSLPHRLFPGHLASLQKEETECFVTLKSHFLVCSVADSAVSTFIIGISRHLQREKPF